MASKTGERNTAYIMYVEQGKTAVEISKAINVSTRSIGIWIDKYHWKEERDARLNSSKERIENIKRVISNLTEQTLEIQKQRTDAVSKKDKKEIALLDIMAVGIADQISKWNKALFVIDKKSRITLDIYLEVMDDIFKNLRAHNQKLFLETLDFQEQHVQQVSSKIG